MSEPHRLDPDYRRPKADGGLERSTKKMLDLNDNKGAKSKALAKKSGSFKPKDNPLRGVKVPKPKFKMC